MKRKNLVIGLWIVLLVTLVIATAPNTPPTLSPTDDAVLFDDVILSCSGSGSVNYEFYVDGNTTNAIQDAFTTTYNWSAANYGLHNWTCRACNNETEWNSKSNGSGYWSFDVDARDDSGNGHSGTVTGATHRTTGAMVNDGDYYFDGSDLIDVGTFNSPVSFGTNFTIALWINATDLTGEEDFMGNKDQVFGDGWMMRKESNIGNITFMAADNGGFEIQCGNKAVLDAGIPTHIALTRASSNWIWYKNGTNVGTCTDADAVENGVNNLQFGGTNDNPDFDGFLDEISIYNTTLNASEITSIYNSGSGFNPYYQECSALTTVRDVNKMNFTNCSSGNIGLNLTFESENNTGTKIDGALPSVSLTFDSDDTGDYDYTFTDNVENNNFTFCMNPSSKSVSTSGTIRFKATGYPERTSSVSRFLNGSYNYPRILYLLPTADGIYSTIQVIDGNSQAVVSDVNVIGEKLISGSYVEVVSGITDDAGSVTFWVDPNAQHRFTFTATGYSSAVSTITPTQSTYTQTLQPSTSINQSNYYQGINYILTPTNSVLGNNEIYNFGLDINSSYWNLTSYGFSLVNSTGDLLIDTSAGQDNGTYVNQTYNTSTNERLTMYYYWTANGNTINNSRVWSVKNVSQGTASLKTFFDRLAVYDAGGADDFTRTLMFIFIFVVLIATLVFFAGDSGFVEYPLMLIAIGMLWLGENIGVIPTIGEKYFITIVVALGVGAYIITDNVR